MYTSLKRGSVLCYGTYPEPCFPETSFLCNSVKCEKRRQLPNIAIVSPTYRVKLLFPSSLRILLTIYNLTYYCLQFRLFFFQNLQQVRNSQAQKVWEWWHLEKLSSGIAQMSIWQSGFKKYDKKVIKKIEAVW